jgi:hypothetical protein
VSIDRNGVVEVTAGSDVAIHIVWSDDAGEAMPCSTPARAEVRGADNGLLVAFDDSADPQLQAAISASPTSGVIQMTAPRDVTDSWAPGRYAIDVFATVNASAPFESGQYRRAYAGWFNVIQPRTQGAP